MACYRADNDIVSASIPNGTTKILTQAFGHCEDLSVVTIPNIKFEHGIDSTLNWQATYTWSSDYRQVTVTLTEPNLNLTRTETATEVYLQSESIDVGITVVAEFPTAELDTRKWLKTLRLPAGIVEIEEEAFMDNNNFEAVIIPSTCHRINSRAFANNKNLKFVFAIDVERANDAFEGCEDVIFIDNSQYLSSRETSNPQIGNYIDYWDGDWYYWGKYY